MALKKHIYLSSLLLSLLWLSGCDNNPQQAADSSPTQASQAEVAATPPIAEQRPYVVASPHGDRQDPYYWLRDDTRSDPEMLAYLNAENAYYDNYRQRYADLTTE